MKKIIGASILAASMIFCLSFAVNNEPGPVMEMVVYHIKPEEVANKEMILNSVNNELKNFTGFISRKVYHSTTDSTVFTDLCMWASLKDANDAMKKIQDGHSCTKFLSSITKVTVFDHFNAVEQ
ncbi:MAG: hypothetical protein NVSMB45_09390 [Ginsengibacter sp.]